MNKKKIGFTVLALTLTMGLVACNNTDNDVPGAASPTASQSQPASPSSSPTESPIPTETPAEQPKPELPPTQSYTVEMEGEKEERVAKLAEGEGYSLYIFEQFSFDPASNKLTMNIDPRYEVEIIKLPAEYKVDQLKAEGTEELKAAGEVKDITLEKTGSIIEDAELYLKASGDNGSKEYMVKEFGGSGYLFKVNIPMGEPTEGFVPLAHHSINSLVNH